MNVTTDPNVFSEPDNIESIIALQLLRDGKDAAFIAGRAELLANRERAFIVSLGLQPSDAVLGDTNIDTE